MECPKCYSENPDDSRFCGKCATPLPSLEEISATPTKILERAPDELTRGTTFAARYEVIEELGKGGMGKVYRVFDKKIEDEVALKLIRHEISSDKKTIERFRNELRISRKIAHRNVCKMYDLSEERGTHYITMEYVPGKSLKNMIGMMGQLSAGQVVFIAKQVCKGLAEAHRLGVVHSDLKPSNIIIDREGNARIMDFGIARSLRAKGITGRGAIIGTPEYMSPEQVEGKEVDLGSDIYSLGVILYEMMTGKLPFEGDTSLSIALKHKTEEPPDPLHYNSQIPEDLSQLILRCMKKDKNKRYKDAKELLSELARIEEGVSTVEKIVLERRPTPSREITVTFRKRWAMILVLFAAVIVAGAVILYLINKRPMPAPEQKMLVVLPFENLGLAEDEYFAEGLTEELTSRLSALHGLGVISRTSAKMYKDTDKTIKQIGEELGVDYVLEGSVRWNRTPDGRGRVRITPQLIRVSYETHLWSDSFDRVIEDIFFVQSEIAEQVTKQLDITVLEPERNALLAKPTDSLEAYNYYLKGLKHEYQGWLNAEPEEFDRAMELLGKAIELDPDFIMAHIWISLVHSWMYFSGWDRAEERLERSKAAVDRALELDPDLPEANLALGYYYYRGLRDYDRALEIFEFVQKARPNTPPKLLGYIQRRQGKWEESLENLKKAFKLNPRVDDTPFQIGLSYRFLRRYQEAEEWFNRALSINPDNNSAKLAIAGLSLLARGNTKEARNLLEGLSHLRGAKSMLVGIAWYDRNYKEVQGLIESFSDDSFYDPKFIYQKDLALASVYRALKDRSLMKTHAESALVMLEKRVKENPNDPRFHASLGAVYAYLDLKEEAIREGKRAVSLAPVSKDAVGASGFVYDLALIYTMVGQVEDAISQLEYLLSIPAGDIISVPTLQMDSDWDPLRENPRFKRLVEEYKK
ncbi:MAG: protein kinase [Candidatus Aminicenantes bacterium]|nr:protein kinase [Candidatus Aminicenantes bacterium]